MVNAIDPDSLRVLFPGTLHTNSEAGARWQTSLRAGPKASRKLRGGRLFGL